MVCLAIDSKITGSGTVTAAKPNYGPGVLEWRDASCPSTLLIDTNVTVKGSMTIISNVTVKGLLLVDHASDTMILNSFDCIEGSGTFQATAGVLRIDSASGDIDNAMDYVVDGGTINCKAGTFDTTGVVTVSSGTLDLDQNFVCTGGITFSGGNINVAANKCAVFSDTAD